MPVLAHLRSFVLPVGAAGVVPAVLLAGSPDLAAPPLPRALAGAALIVAGLAMLAWTVGLFARVGGGTLAPWDPTRRLVVAGPYAHVRNPMIAGVLCVLVGEATVFASRSVAIWAGAFVAINHVYFVLSEEPGLVRRFGAEYVEYARNVPRWLPRLSPYRPAGPPPSGAGD